ncbi:MAG: GNAT family N-acetyltransferase, partial [Stellaceae bacterium]
MSLVAVLPAALVASLLFGRKLVSQPFSEYGGLLVDRTLDRDDMASIYALLGDYLKRDARLRALELHGSHGILAPYRPGPFVLLNPHHVAILALDKPVDRLWQGLEPALRNKVNKAQANGVVAFEECNLTLILERFYPLYLLSMKRLGVPPHPLAYYTRCLEFLGTRLKIFWAARNGEVLAAILGFVCGSRVSIINTVSNPDSWKYAPNDLMHWEFVKWAAAAGLKYFDFGSVRYDG